MDVYILWHSRSIHSQTVKAQLAMQIADKSPTNHQPIIAPQHYTSQRRSNSIILYPKKPIPQPLLQTLKQQLRQLPTRLPIPRRRRHNKHLQRRALARPQQAHKVLQPDPRVAPYIISAVDNDTGTPMRRKGLFEQRTTRLQVIRARRDRRGALCEVLVEGGLVDADAAVLEELVRNVAHDLRGRDFPDGRLVGLAEVYGGGFGGRARVLSDVAGRGGEPAAVARARLGLSVEQEEGALGGGGPLLVFGAAFEIRGKVEGGPAWCFAEDGVEDVLVFS